MMDFSKKIPDIQLRLKENHIDGWLLYDFHRSNNLAIDFLMLPSDAMLTRRFFYWIPAKGECVKIVHSIEPGALDHLPGKKEIYFKWENLESILAEILKGSKKVAMEYYPRGAIPYVSKVDGGIIDLVRGYHVEVVSSAPILQFYTSVLDDFQLETHKEAAHFLDRTALNVWDHIAHAINKNQPVTEYSIQQFMMNEFEKHGFETDHAPICCTNAHTADPHYSPDKENSAVIQKGDFILIDLWCKKKEPRSVFGDITRVAVASTSPTDKHIEVHHIVRKAQKAATDYLQSQLSNNRTVRGYEVDRVARKVIEDAGYGEFFIHRTGHNIYTDLHGPGTNLDSLETFDERFLIPKTCFSVEPGIYLPGEFGVRQEYDIYIDQDSRIQINGGVQEKITTIF